MRTSRCRWRLAHVALPLGFRSDFGVTRLIRLTSFTNTHDTPHSGLRNKQVQFFRPSPARAACPLQGVSVAILARAKQVTSVSGPRLLAPLRHRRRPRCLGGQNAAHDPRLHDGRGHGCVTAECRRRHKKTNARRANCVQVGCYEALETAREAATARWQPPRMPVVACKPLD